MKYIKFIGLVLLIVIIAIMGIFIFFAGSMCKNDIYQEYLSPNKLLKAVVYQRDCGATTGFSTQISIIEVNDSLGNKNGNIYIIKGEPKNVAPQISWNNNKQLVIYAPITGLEFKAEKSLGWFSEIEVEYK